MLERRSDAALPEGFRTEVLEMGIRDERKGAGWLAYGALVCRKSLEVMWAKICRPGSTYGRGDRENHVSKKKICRPGFYVRRESREKRVRKKKSAGQGFTYVKRCQVGVT
jgi:hypothetical protein